MASGPARSYETARSRSVIEVSTSGFPKPGDTAHFAQAGLPNSAEALSAQDSHYCDGWDCAGANVDVGSNSVSWPVSCQTRVAYQVAALPATV